MVKKTIPTPIDEFERISGELAIAKTKLAESERDHALAILKLEAAEKRFNEAHERGLRVIAHAQKVEMLLGVLADVSGSLVRAVLNEKVGK